MPTKSGHIIADNRLFWYRYYPRDRCSREWNLWTWRKIHV